VRSVAPRALPKLVQPAPVAIARHQLAAVAHPGGERQRLRPRPRTHRPPPARLRAASLGDQLAPLILHLEQAGLERLEREHVVRPVK